MTLEAAVADSSRRPYLRWMWTSGGQKNDRRQREQICLVNYALPRAWDSPSAKSGRVDEGKRLRENYREGNRPSSPIASPAPIRFSSRSRSATSPSPEDRTTEFGRSIETWGEIGG